MIVNGVTLPDIPDDVLATYPNAVIIHSKVTVDAYYLLVSPSFFGVIAGSLVGQIYDNLVGTFGAGIQYAYTVGHDYGLGWMKQSEFTAGSGMLPLMETEVATYSLVWANHDVYEIIALNMTTGDCNIGAMYFRNSNDPLPERLSVPSSFLEDAANYIREWLSGIMSMQRIGLDTIRNTLPWLKPIEQTVSGFISGYYYGSQCYKGVCLNVSLLNLQTAHQYIIDFDGFKYFCVATLFNDSGEQAHVIGNRTFIGETETVSIFAKIPFCIVERDGSTEIFTSASGESHTISVVYLGDID